MQTAFSPSILLILASAYIGLLFFIAWRVDRRQLRSPMMRALVYALSLAVYCSSWTFYGAVGSAVSQPWSYVPIFLGPTLLFIFGWSLVKRLLEAGGRHQVTSIADYMGARYGKRPKLAVLVTIVSLTAVLPYIALQLRAVVQTWHILSPQLQSQVSDSADSAFVVAAILALFAVLFGTRRIEGRERLRGVMAAIAVESLIKFFAFMLVAALAVFFLLGEARSVAIAPLVDPWKTMPINSEFIARTLVSALAILCLPRTFHVMVVESPPDAKYTMARWVFPLYLLLFLVMVVPVALAGQVLFGAQTGSNPDTWVQTLPVALGSDWIAVAAFIGGFSAATSMAIVAVVSVAIMITNEIVSPMMMRLNAESPEAVLRLGDRLRRIRQWVIVVIMFASWLVLQGIDGIPWLAQIGFISFLAAAQLGPGLIAGLYWRGGHGIGVISGIVAGLLLWIYCAVLPVVLPDSSALLRHGPLGIDWLRPSGLLGIEAHSRLAYATVWSLGVNVALFFLVSLLAKASPADERQARVFIDKSAPFAEESDDFELSLIRISQLQSLLPPFMAADEREKMWTQFETRYQQRLLPGDRAPRFVVNHVESVLAGIIGASTAHRAMGQLEDSQQLAYADLAGMVTEASRQHTFNRELLQTTVESLVQGVAVVDAELRLVAWNSRYEELFEYPERFLYVGCPIERVYRFNYKRGMLNLEGDEDEQVAKRLAWLRSGHSYRLERTLPNGTVIEIRGNKLPHGGYVATYIDITEHRDVTTQLKETTQELEAKVESGQELLSTVNARLRQENRLRAQMEASLREAHQSKTRFMSATSHDLLQPINAARLFMQALTPRLAGGADAQSQHMLAQIDSSLNRAEQLISELREISRLDSGRQKVSMKALFVADFLRSLHDEFLPLAKERGLTLRLFSMDLWVYSDEKLLRRIVQNLLANALKYTRSGGVLLGVRRKGESLQIQIWDTGPGIDAADHARMFDEFERLTQGSSAEGVEGLGLGLSIVRRYAQLLGHRLDLRSRLGRGTMFSVQVPVTTDVPTVVDRKPQSEVRDLNGMSLICLDNDALVREGMLQMLSTLQAKVLLAADRSELHSLLSSNQDCDVILADYHLDDGDTGVKAVRECLASVNRLIPCIVISADDSDAVRADVQDAGYYYMSKPVRGNRLAARIRALTRLKNKAASP